MKTIFGAVALILAAPVAAQSAPAPDPHAAHKQGAPHNEQKHDMGCCKMPCCAKMKQSAAEKKGCCAEGGKAPSGQDGKQHSGH